MKIFFHNTQANKYSINALSYVIEKIPGIDVYFFNKVLEVERFVEPGEINLFVFSFMSPFYEKESFISLNIKKRFPFAITICGGVHLSRSTKDNALKYFDYVFIGEGEKIFYDFVITLLNGVSITQRFFVNLKPVEINDYKSISEKYKRFGSIEITRGCPYGCFFCANSFNTGKIPRHKSVDNIINEIEILLRNNFRDIRFITPDLAAYGSADGKTLNLKEFKNFVDGVYETVKDKGRVFLGSFPSELRPEHICDDVLSILKGKTYSKRIIIGAQSGSNDILKKINRNHTVEDVIKACKLLNKYGFNTEVDFIFGFPFETEKDLKETEKVINLITEKYKAIIHLHYFIPLPNTPFQNLKPKPLDKKTRRFLSSLTSKKIAYGQWENQLKIGLKSYH